MATITAGNFYWTGYKPAGLDPDFVYERGTTAFGTALSFVGGAGGCTGYSWNEPGNWVVQKSGVTNDPDNPGVFIEGFYYEDAPRAPRAGDNVFYTELTPDAPGIDGFFPASECLFGGITGATDAGGGTWEAASGSGFTGNLNKVFVENDYSSSRGATFHLGNVIGSTFGQTFLGNSADIVLRGLTGLFGRGVTTNLIFTNTDGTTVEFLGNTFLNYIHGGTGSAAISAGISLQVELNENQFFIGTENKSGYGVTQATQALYNSLVTGVSSGYLKMDINTYTVGATYFGVTQNIPGVGGNTSLTGGANPPGANENGAFFLSEVQGISAGNSPTGAGGAFSGGTDNPVEQPKLVIKTDTLTVRGDSNINFNDTTVDKQAFILSKCQFNYNAGLINQFILDREGIDYLGTPKTSASLLDTEVSNSVVISGGGFQSQTETELTKLDYPEVIEPANIGDGYTASNGPYPGLYFISNTDGLANMLPPNTTPGGQPGDGGPLNMMIEFGGLASCDDPNVPEIQYSAGCTFATPAGVGGRYDLDLFYGRQKTAEDYPGTPADPRAGNIERVLSFTEGALYRIGNGTLSVDLNETPFLGDELGWGDPDDPAFDADRAGRMYVRLYGNDSQREVILLVNNQSPNMQMFDEKGDFFGCDADCSNEAGSGGTADFFRCRRWSDAGASGSDPQASFDVIYESHQYIGGTSGIEPEAYFQHNEKISATFIPIPAERAFTNEDVSGSRPVTYVRPTNTIPNVVIDALRHGNVIIEGAATTLDMKPEHEHKNGQGSQGKVFINRPLDFNDRLNYTTINLKSYNDAQNIAGTKDNNLLILNSGLTIGTLDIGAGTVSVGGNIGDRPITVVKGEMSERAVLKARSETNPSYQGFKIGDDFTAITSNAEGILISHPEADIQFSTGHYVLASFADGNTGADTGFQRPGGAIPAPPPPKGG